MSNMVTAAGTRLGRYKVCSLLGKGGMGEVWLAHDTQLDRTVALKILPFAGALDPKHLQRFKNEAQAAAHLHHTNIVPVYFVGSERGVHYYAMQLIEGLYGRASHPGFAATSRAK